MESFCTIKQLVDELIDSLRTQPQTITYLPVFSPLSEFKLSPLPSSTKSLEFDIGHKDVVQNLNFCDLHQTSTRLTQESNEILKQLENIKKVDINNKSDNFQQHKEPAANINEIAKVFMKNNNKRKFQTISEDINKQSYPTAELKNKENIPKFLKISRATIRIGLSKHRPTSYSQQWKNQVFK